MFFVLSGFLIVTLLLRERDRNAQISLKAFYARRTLRIMPLYYGVVIGTALLFMVFGPDGETWQSMRHSPGVREGLACAWASDDVTLVVRHVDHGVGVHA